MRLDACCVHHLNLDSYIRNEAERVGRDRGTITPLPRTLSCFTACTPPIVY